MKKGVTINLEIRTLNWIDARKGEMNRSQFIEHIIKGRIWEDEIAYR